MKRYYCSYFDRNYLVRAVALIESLNKLELNSFTFYAVCMDELTRLVLDKLALPNVVTVPMHEIELRDTSLLAAKRDRSVVEYYWTCTPSIILRLIEKNPEIDILTYVDSDMRFYSSPDAIYNELANNSILIHEHRYCPELQNLAQQGGRFNVGLMQFRKDQTGIEALNWWRDRCIEWCYWRFEDGKMGDQRYLHDWPERFPNVSVLQNVGAGLAPWNHTQYDYKLDKHGNLLVNGAPLVFYHYQSLTIVNTQLIIPAGHTTYPLTAELIERCFVPYADALVSALDQVRTIIPDFAFGVASNDSLSANHTFIAKKEMESQIKALNAPQQPVLIENSDWVLYKSEQVIEKGRAMPKPAGQPKSATSQSPVPSLWNTGRTVVSEDDLLRELFARPISQHIETAYIVGAHRYQERNLINSLFPNLKNIYLFEPLPGLYQMLKGLELEDNRIKVFPYAISDTNGQAEFNVTTNDAASSSLLPIGKHQEIFPHVGVSQKIPVQCRALDTVIKENNLSEPDILFLDVQGAEYSILSAISPERIANIRLIYTEASKEELFVGSRPLDDLISLLEPSQKYLGFAPLVQGLWNHGNALFVNANDVGLLEAAPVKSKGKYKVSAIVSTYNSEKYIRGCLDDLIAQSLYRKGGLEIVVINTGSQQNEAAIVEEYRQKYDHIKHIHTDQRETVYGAWNRGIKAASGQYITNANTDDRHRVDALEKMAQVLDSRSDIALVYADVDITTMENARFGEAPIKGKFTWREFDRQTMFQGCYMGPQPMWRRSLHDRYGYFDDTMRTSGDYEFWLRMCMTETYLHIPETLGLYLESPSSIEHTSQDVAGHETLTALQRYWTKAWDPNPAIGVTESSMQPAASSQGSLINQAMVIANQGDTKTARSMLWKEIESNPGSAPAYYNLAAVLVMDGKILEAVDQACKAVELDPSDTDAVHVLTKAKILLKTIKPAAKSKGKKQPQGPTQAEIDSRLQKANSLLASAASVAAKPKAKPAARPSIALCMIVRDEEAFIDDCLKSVEGFVDEMVIVDTGSKDRTIEIAEKYGASIHKFKWNGSFADARNFALKQVTSDWVLALDADEHLDAGSKPVIENAVSSGNAEAFDLTVCNYLSDGPDKDVEISVRCSLFANKPEYRYIGRVHEQIGQSITENGGRAARCQAVIYHYGYRPEVKTRRKKHEKYVEMLKKEVAGNPESAYFLYHLGSELAANGSYAEAIPALRQAEKLMDAGHNLAPLTYARLAESLMATRQYAEAVDAVHKAEYDSIRHPQLSYCKGNILRCTGQYDGAVDAFGQAIMLGKQGLWDGDPSCYGYKAEYGLAASYLALGHAADALEHARAAQKIRPHDTGINELISKAEEAAKSPAPKPAATKKNAHARPTLSLCMIAKNEESFLGKCLESAKSIVDEIIIVDTGSDDKTIEIAESYSAKIHYFPWNNNYSDARNESLKHATCDWILVLDADEQLDPLALNTIRSEIANPRGDAYNLRFQNYMTGGDKPDMTMHRVCRLFRNRPNYRYESSIHEHVEDVIVRCGGIIGELDALVHHYGYRADIVADRNKHEKYTKILQEEVEKNPDNVFYLYHFSSALCAGREYERALSYLRRAADIVTPDSVFAPIIFAHLANAYNELGRFEESLQSVEKARRIGIAYPQISFCKGNAFVGQKKYAEAIEAYQEAIVMGRGKVWTGDYDTVGYKADFGIASANFELKNYQKAIEYAEYVLAAKPDSTAALDLLARTYHMLNDQPMIEKYLLKLHQILPGDPGPIIRLGEVNEALGKFTEAYNYYSSLINMGEETAVLRVKLGNLAESLGQVGEAEAHLIRSIDLDKQSAEPHNALGRLRITQGRYQEALDCFSRAIELSPQSASAYFNAGDLLYEAGEYAQAADLYQAGLERDSTHAPAFLRLGNSYVQMGVPEAAAIAYRQALEISPEYAEAANNLAIAEEMLMTSKAA